MRGLCPAFFFVLPTVSIPAYDTFQLQLTPLNSTPTSLRMERPGDGFGGDTAGGGGAGSTNGGAGIDENGAFSLHWFPYDRVGVVNVDP